MALTVAQAGEVTKSIAYALPVPPVTVHGALAWCIALYIPLYLVIASWWKKDFEQAIREMRQSVREAGGDVRYSVVTVLKKLQRKAGEEKQEKRDDVDEMV